MNNIRFKPKLNIKTILSPLLTTLILALICCSVADDTTIQESYNDIKDDSLKIMQYSSSEELSEEFKQKLFDSGISFLGSDNIVSSIKNTHPKFTTEDSEFKSLFDKLNGEFKEEFIDKKFKIEKIKLEAEEAIKQIPDTQIIKEELEHYLGKAYRGFYLSLADCMYDSVFTKKTSKEKLDDFFKGIPDVNGFSFSFFLKHMNATKKRAILIKKCMAKGIFRSPIGSCDQRAEKRYPYPILEPAVKMEP
ncbi:hypothetical protein DB313_05035 (plasmid) [Borrelia turcica IST7]|uniref:Lipoprotein n=1 Tax=Borrelia turcica IST7 TaxID=1104446 RepID=A0A386PMT2_9SPIR|nr:hypothetical protein [Borrelia turcica]AYE36864.1 hypothetical protein DB313_05035 [Borrelia turcica IST7]